MKLCLALLIVAATLVLPWQPEQEITALAATPYTVSRLTLQPTRVAAGQVATVTAWVRSRTTGVATIEVTAVARGNRVVWRQTWPEETFTARQSRSFSATWAVPGDQAAGAYTLVARVVNPRGANLTKARTLRFQVRAGTAGSGPPATTPNQVVAPTPAPASYPFAITGSAAFTANIRSGLEMLREMAPDDYATVATHVTEIKEGSQNWAWGGSRIIQISTNSAGYSRTYAGSIVLHEATHVKNWFTDNQPVFGCEGEAKSLSAQAAYLRKVGDNGMAAWVESLIGTWC